MLVFGFSVAVEIIQCIFARGAADIDDVILNTLGGVVGYGVHTLLSRFSKAKKHAAILSTLMIAVTCIGFYSFDNYRFLVDRPAPGDHPGLSETLDGNFNNPSIIDEQPIDPFSTDTVINSDANAADVQTNADEAAWYLMLVNKWNYIPDDYEVELTELSNGQSVDARIYPALQEMFDVARSEGLYLVAVSGYRTAETQQRLLDEKIAEYRALGYSAENATVSAEAWVAVPGTSEHQLGIAVDINADGIYSTGYEVYEWLEQNAYKYGFICRYPSDKTEITGVINEPWHYRYVGVEAATEIHNQGVCLEEYLNNTN
jgi:D-alanyl-D-alanine carboxypeptidase